jgi:PilZ domain
MKERRKAPRLEALRSGTIVFGSNEIPCTIRDFSPAGACLVVETTLGIPAVFELVMPNKRSCRCKVRWCHATTLGVSLPGRYC